MDFILFDEELVWKNLLPLTFTRPVSEIRIGILTIKEKWDKYLNADCGYSTQNYLSKKFSRKHSEKLVFINSKFSPNTNLVNEIKSLKQGQALYKNGTKIAVYGEEKTKIEFAGTIFEINNVYDIFLKNAEAINSDFELLTKGRVSQPLSSTVTVIGDKQKIFLEQGAKAEACILNTTTGCIYIGKDAEIMEGSVIRGALALCEHSVVKMSTKIYGATTIGVHSKVGGELNNSVIFGYSNKAHDGFLGNSVLGEWCNLGADTNNSNLKNNYGNVKLYNYAQQKSIDTGLQFCGIIMGDHSKSGINTMFNTGTVVGVGCNIFGGGFPATHIPNFSWGGNNGFENYQLEKLYETAEKMYERRGLKFSDMDKEVLQKVLEYGN